MTSFLFVHSPLVGPSSLRRLADLAAAEGTKVAVPDLTPMAAAAHPHRTYTDRAIEAASDLASPVAVIGHSVAGPFLPTIGAAVGPATILVFVDAVVPPESGRHRTPGFNPPGYLHRPIRGSPGDRSSRRSAHLIPGENEHIVE